MGCARGGGGGGVFVGKTTGTGVLVRVGGGSVLVGAGVSVGPRVGMAGVSVASLVGRGVNVDGTLMSAGGNSPG